MTESQAFSVKDWERTFEFRGVLLGHASSYRPSKMRWAEMSIYMTDAGQYIVSGIGQTVVKEGDVIWDDRQHVQVVVEKDEQPRAWAHVCESAEGVIQSLYLYDDDGIRYMTNISRTALAFAMREDSDLRAAFMVEQVA